MRSSLRVPNASFFKTVSFIYCQNPCWRPDRPQLRPDARSQGSSRQFSDTSTSHKSARNASLAPSKSHKQQGSKLAFNKQRIRGDINEYIGKFCDDLTKENLEQKIGDLIGMEVPLGKSLKAEDLKTAGWQLMGTKGKQAKPVAILERLYSDQDLLTNPNYIKLAPSKPFVTPETPFNSDSQDLRGVDANVLTEMRVQTRSIASSKDGCASIQFHPPWDVISNIRTSRPGIVVRTTRNATPVPTVFEGSSKDRKLPAFHHAIQRKLTTTMVKRGFMKAWKEISANPPDGLYIITMRAQKLDPEWSYELFKEVFQKVKANYANYEKTNTVQQLLKCKINKTTPSKFYCETSDWIKPDGSFVHNLPHNLPVTRDCRHWWSYYCLGDTSPSVLRAIERNPLPSKALNPSKVKPEKIEHAELIAKLQRCITGFRKG